MQFYVTCILGQVQETRKLATNTFFFDHLSKEVQTDILSQLSQTPIPCNIQKLSFPKKRVIEYFHDIFSRRRDNG